MTLYTKEDGTPLSLATHSREEWADATYDRLRALGCSPGYAKRIANEIRGAK